MQVAPSPGKNSVSLRHTGERNLENNNAFLRTLPGEILVNVNERHFNALMWIV